MNVCIFSPHEDKDNYTNRNLIYSKWARKDNIFSTIYVSSFNYKTKYQKKLTNFFYEKKSYNGIKIYRIYSSPFYTNNLSRFFSYIIFSVLSLFVYYFIDNKKKYDYVIGESVPPICAYIAFLCSLKNSSKFIYQIRDPWPLSLVFSGLIKKNNFIFIFFEMINRFLIKKSAFLISSLPYLKNHYLKFYNYKKKIYYLRNPAVVYSIKKKKYPRIKNKIKIVFAGGFPQSIKIMNYFEAINYIQKKKKVFSFDYYFLGEGIEINKCQNYVVNNNLKNIYFLKSRSKNKVVKFVSKCHLCVAVVSNNKNSKFGYNLNKIIDYTISGRPVILTNNHKKKSIY